MQFSNKSYEENITEYENILKEKMEFIDLMQQFYSWIELSKIVGSDSQQLQFQMQWLIFMKTMEKI